MSLVPEPSQPNSQEVNPLSPQEQTEIVNNRTRITEAIQKALGDQLRSRDDVSFEGHVGPAWFSNLRMVHIPSERQENGEAPVWRLRLDGYRDDRVPNHNLPADPLLDTNGISPAVVELSLDEEDSTKDIVRVLPSIVISMEYDLSPKGILEGIRFAKNEGRQVEELTQEQAEAKSQKSRAEYFEKYHEEFALAATRTPTPNDYQVFSKSAEVIEGMVRLYGDDTFQTPQATVQH
ncbi:MAG: hypothetical protein AAB414_01040 [Patescibacteria group bacterium]